jgi:hypothetical protein
MGVLHVDYSGLITKHGSQYASLEKRFLVGVGVLQYDMGNVRGKG